MFGRIDRSLKRKVALIWPGHKLETEKRENWSQKGERRERGYAVIQKTLRVIYFGLFSGSFNYGLFNFPTYRNNDRSNVLTQYKT